MTASSRPRRTFYQWFLRFCARFGDAELPVGYPLAALGFFVMIRNFLELSLMEQQVEAVQLVHYTLFYFGLATSLALLLHGLTGRPILYVVRLVFPGMIITLLPPTLDASVFAHLHPAYDYLPAGSAREVWHAYLTWFGPLVEKGVTPGMRTEIGLATLSVFVFVHAHTGRLVRGLLGAVAGYTIMFAWVALPVFIELPLQFFGAHWERDGATGTRLIVLLCVGLVVTGFARHAPTLFRSVLRDARYLRLLHYELMFVGGLCLAGSASEFTPPVDYALRVALGGAAVAFAWIFAVINNNVFDVELDRINAPERPLVSGAVPLERYVHLGWATLVLALGLALAVHAAALVLIAIFCVGYFVYSSPPLRLKENCGVSKFVIGLNSVCCLVLGSGLSSGRLDGATGLLFAVFAWFSLGAHLIDLKDVPGDARAGIRNLSTILGQARAQRVIGVSAVLAHLLAAWALRETPVAALVALAGLAQWWFVTRRPYRELPVLWLQNLVTLLAIFALAS